MNETNSLFYDNINLVEKIAHHLNYGYCDLEDLIQAGLMGLFQATIKYDEKKNAAFKTFATYYIIGAMKKEMRTNQPIIISKGIMQLVRKLKQCEHKSINELASQFNCSKENILLALLYKDKIKSLNERLDDRELIDNVIDNNNLHYLKMALHKLDNISQELIVLKYFKGYSQKEIAEYYQCSQAKISRLEKVALIQMKNYV